MGTHSNSTRPVALPYGTGDGWIDDGAPYQPGEYWKDPVGQVHVHGRIKAFVTAPSVICVLPRGFRPKNTEVFVVDSDGAHGRVDIAADGTVTLIAGNGTYVSLSSITFAAT